MTTKALDLISLVNKARSSIGDSIDEASSLNEYHILANGKLVKIVTNKRDLKKYIKDRKSPEIFFKSTVQPRGTGPLASYSEAILENILDESVEVPWSPGAPIGIVEQYFADLGFPITHTTIVDPSRYYNVVKKFPLSISTTWSRPYNTRQSNNTKKTEVEIYRAGPDLIAFLIDPNDNYEMYKVKKK